MVNYNTSHKEAAYKYFLQVFYNKINKKEYDLQIRQHNVHHTNIVAMKDVIILEKSRKKEKLSEDIMNTNVPTEVAWVSSSVDLIWRYKSVMSNPDLDIAKKLELTGVKKYWRHAGQVEMELD